MKSLLEKMDNLVLTAKNKVSNAASKCASKMKALHEDQSGMSTFLEVIIIISIVAVIAAVFILIGNNIKLKSENVNEFVGDLELPT